MSGINRLKNIGAAGQKAAAIANQAYQSGHQIINEAPCVILRMFDPYTLGDTSDNHVNTLAAGKTGYLYVEVRELVSGVIRVLPLNQPPDFVQQRASLSHTTAREASPVFQWAFSTTGSIMLVA